MKSFQRALIPIKAEDLVRVIDQIEKLLVVSGWMDCDPHLFIHGDPTFELDSHSLSALAQSSSSRSLSIHRSRGNPIQEVQELIETRKIDILILNTTPDELIALARIEREILKSTRLPALLVPKQMTASGIPRSLLIPFSGERQTNHAVALGIRISNEKHIPLDLLHVARKEGDCSCDHFLESYGDQFHYEYPKMIDELVAQASPFSTTAERRCVRAFKHVRGEIGEEIVASMESQPDAWLVLDWGGSMEPGRAHIIKRELRRYRYPILLVHAAAKHTVRLKVGSEFVR